MRRRVRVVSAAVVAAVATVLALGVVPASATAIGLSQPSIASPLPNGAGVKGTVPTPNIVDGAVLDAEQMSNGHIVVAGTFTQVQDMATAGQPTLSRSGVFSFDPTTGVVDTGFAPAISGAVNAVWPGPVAGTVYVAGAFSSPGRNLVLLDLGSGSPVGGFNPPAINGAINDIELAAGRLFIGGVFTTVGGVSHGGLASLNPATGALDPYLSIDVAVHHNWTPGSTGAQAPVGVTKLDVAATGDRMAVIGNFKQVNGLSRDQAAVIDLPSATGSSATLDPWMTAKYQAACASNAFDSYVRGVQWSPDGTYFVITATGGGGNTTSTYCDAAARFNWPDPNGTTTAGASAYWIDYTGNDTLYSVAISGSAVYVGGHERWLNNALGVDKAGPGAVPRPGVAALDPLNGLPLSWNPGRNPRGVGAQTLLLTSQGVYVGSDTNYIGFNQYLRKKIAFFPLSGAPLASQDISNLSTGQVYLAGIGGTDSVVARPYNGTSAGQDQNLGNAGSIPWSQTRGAVWIGGNLYYGRQDPANASTWELVKQPFDGSAFGSPTFITTPYKDPYWDGKPTGTGTTTYDGAFPNFYSAGELGSVTGMFYWKGQLYYTKTVTVNKVNTTALYSRGFSVDSGIVSARATTVKASGFMPSGVLASGMFLDGGNLYVADTAGNLYRRTFDTTSGAIGTTVTKVSGSNPSWSSQGLFVAPKQGTPPVNQPPTAAFTAPTNCTVNTSCSFTSTSSDPEGGSLTYSWDFGDPASGANTSNLQNPTHAFSTSGPFTVSLTVTDNQGAASAPATQQVNVSPAVAASGIAFRTAAGNATPKGGGTISVAYPPGIQSGDGLVLILSTNSGATGTPNDSYSQVGSPTVVPVSSSNPAPAMTTQVFRKVATGGESGTLTVTLTASAKATLQLLVYAGTAGTDPVRSVTSAVDNGSSSHRTPDSTANAGDWVLSVWSDKSSVLNSWNVPADLTGRSNIGTTGLTSEIASLVADQGVPAAGGPVAGESASITGSDSKATMLTVVLAGS